MKPILPLIAGAAVVAAAISSWSPVAHAQQAVATPVDQKAPYPVGCRCVVTLDPQDPGKRREGQVNADNYQVIDNKAEGNLISVNSEWIVLKDGNYENWIPRDKVLFMRVSR